MFDVIEVARPSCSQLHGDERRNGDEPRHDAGQQFASQCLFVFTRKVEGLIDEHIHACAPIGIAMEVEHLHALLVIPFLTRSEEHTSELQSLMRISYAVFCLKKQKHPTTK